MRYEEVTFKVPKQSEDYDECSRFVTTSIEAIMRTAIQGGRNKIIINTNLKLGLPMENINKIAGPFVEAWAVEIFQDVLEDKKNKYALINVEAKERLHMADVILQFRKARKNESGVTAEVDVKATAEDIESSGKSPNITAFKRIRTAYIDDPDYIFIILSLKHKVYSTKNNVNGLMDGIMEVVAHNTYDLKYLSSPDISYNPALGSGQLQVRDIHYVTLTKRTTWEFCQLLDRKFIGSKKGFTEWLKMAKTHGGSRQMNNIEIITGDALVELSNIKSDSVDLVVADPPYNLGKDYGNNHDIHGFDEYLSFSNKWLKQAHRIVKPSGTLYVFMGFKFISYLFDILDRDLMMYFNSWIVWHYTQGIGKTKGFSPFFDQRYQSHRIPLPVGSWP
mgnify:CR=1 FL=1